VISRLSSTWRPAAAVVLFCPLLAACLSAQTRNVADSFDRPSARVTIASSLGFDSLDPASDDLGIGLIAPNLYQAPLRVVADGGSVEPEAARCEFHDATTYVCALVPGQAFSNGDPLTAHDVVFSIRRAIGLGGQDVEDLFAPMTAMRASGNNVTFTLSAPDAAWPFALASSYASIVDHRVFPKGDLLTEAVVGSGPYRVSERATDGSITLTPNPHYGGSDHVDNARVVLKSEAGDDSLVSDLTAGAVDIVAPVSTLGVWTALRDVPGATQVAGPPGEVRLVGFDEAVMPGNGADHRLAIRRAVAQAIDRSAILDQIPDSTQPLSVVGPTDLPSDDPSAAATTLDTAGVTTPVEMTLTYNDDHLGDGGLAGGIQSVLDATGLFKVTLTDVPWERFPTEVASGKYGVYLYGSSQIRQIAALQARVASGDGLLVPLWRQRIGAVARAGVTGVDGALAMPGALAFWELGKRAAE
jgi:peptide/nickel transport system substrate-binding protein